MLQEYLEFIQKFMMESTEQFCWDSSGNSCQESSWNLQCSHRIYLKKIPAGNASETPARAPKAKLVEIFANTLREFLDESLKTKTNSGGMAIGIYLGILRKILEELQEGYAKKSLQKS